MPGDDVKAYMINIHKLKILITITSALIECQYFDMPLDTNVIGQVSKKEPQNLTKSKN